MRKLENYELTTILEDAVKAYEEKQCYETRHDLEDARSFVWKRMSEAERLEEKLKNISAESIYRHMRDHGHMASTRDLIAIKKALVALTEQDLKPVLPQTAGLGGNLPKGAK